MSTVLLETCRGFK